MLTFPWYRGASQFARPAVPAGRADGIVAKIAECDRKLAQYRAALDAGADPATVTRWITETEAERAGCQATRRAAAPRPAATSMSRDEIASAVQALAGLIERWVARWCTR